MAKAKTVPVQIDAETVLQMTLNIFRDRVIGGKPMTDRDVQVLENSMRAYGDVRVKERKVHERLSTI
jgi:hypothetical protein